MHTYHEDNRMFIEEPNKAFSLLGLTSLRHANSVINRITNEAQLGERFNVNILNHFIEYNFPDGCTLAPRVSPIKASALNPLGYLYHNDKENNIIRFSLGKDNEMPLVLALLASNQYVKADERGGPIHHYFRCVSLDLEKIFITFELSRQLKDMTRREYAHWHVEAIYHLMKHANAILEKVMYWSSSTRMPLLMWEALRVNYPLAGFSSLCAPKDYCTYLEQPNYQEYRRTTHNFFLDIVDKSRQVMVDNGIQVYDQFLVDAPGYRPIQIETSLDSNW